VANGYRMCAARDAIMDETYIGTGRLILRSMRWDDVDAFALMWSDPQVLAAFEMTEFPREGVERWVRRNLEHQARHGFGLFSVLLRTGGLLIGDCGLERMDLDGEIVHELGYDFRSDFWGRGYATEAARAVGEHAFGTLGLSLLVSLIRVGNTPSQRVAERIGMRPRGQIVRHGVAYWRYELKRRDKAPCDRAAELC
jgi:[ribosomal protein S5]-alanine N-acetyltransferase